MNNFPIIKSRMKKKLGTDTGGYQIMSVRRPRKNIPEWIDDTEKIQRFLLRSFPLLKTNSKQRKQAARWARIIHLYYRRQWSESLIAEELGLTIGAVRSLIRSIRWSAQGQAHGKPRRRPEKMNQSVIGV